MKKTIITIALIGASIAGIVFVLNRNKENIKKIRDSKVYKELEKMGEIIKKI